MKNTIYLLVGIIFIGGAFYMFLSQPASPKYAQIIDPEAGLEAIDVGGTRVLVDVADTSAERAMGLSGRESLGEARGMLFVFDKVGEHGIWMKDMNFPIDILWLDEEMRVIWIERSVSPDSYPKVFYPQGDAKYVLELPAGFSESYYVDTGTIVSSRG